MTAFSAEWLDRREPADHRSRNRKLEHALAKHFDGWRPITVVDLGCGTGSNLRATAPLLGPEQHWTLVDHERPLLDAAAERLTAWADGSDWKDGKLALFKGAKRINVEFRRADLARDLEAALGPNANLLTASALFDLGSADFIGRFAAAVAARKSAFYTVLTYDGDQRWTPEHEADAAMGEAFHAHQKRDKGFGPSAGPDAPDALSDAFSRPRLRRVGRRQRLAIGVRRRGSDRRARRRLCRGGARDGPRRSYRARRVVRHRSQRRGSRPRRHPGAAAARINAVGRAARLASAFTLVLPAKDSSNLARHQQA